MCIIVRSKLVLISEQDLTLATPKRCKMSGSRFLALDPLGIPSGSHMDPKLLMRQPPALFGDQLLNSLQKGQEANQEGEEVSLSLWRL